MELSVDANEIIAKLLASLADKERQIAIQGALIDKLSAQVETADKGKSEA